MKLKTWQKNILSAVVIAVGGFVLFNLAFILLAVTMQVFRMATRSFGGNNDFAINPMLLRYVFAIILLLVSWLILRSKLGTLVKATYLTMPLMVLLILEGILLYEQPKWVPVCVGAVIVGAVIFYLYKRKLTWQYYFAAIYTGALALYVMLAGVDI